MISVSVIILTYNPDWDKLCKTIKSTLLQENISKEIIIADDGSNCIYDCKIEELMKTFHFNNYKFVHHEKNVGTVKNYYDALNVCEGEYEYGISPGDYFYDNTTLCGLYSFAQNRGLSVVFGNAVYYKGVCQENKIVELVNNMIANPYNPYVFEQNRIKSIESVLLSNNNILGATYFRKTDCAKKCIEKFVGVAKYLEDFPALVYALIINEPIGWYKKYIVWYEYGLGVSTSTNSGWTRKLLQDYTNSCRVLSNIYKCNDELRKLLIWGTKTSKFDKLVFVLNGNWDILLKKMILKYCKKEKVNAAKIDSAMIAQLYK